MNVSNQPINKIDTLNLVHVQRRCSCPEWIEISRLKKPGGAKDDDYIYLEAARPELKLSLAGISLADSGHLLRVEGSFYEEKAVPGDMLQRSGQKSDSARVFRYFSSDLIKPE